MTTLVCDFIDIIGEPIDGVASLSTGEVRPDYSHRSVKVPHPVSETVVAGQATFSNVRPGKAVLTVHWEGRSATFRFTVPDTEIITLIDATAGEGLEQSELDEFRAGIAAEFNNTRNAVIEAAASASRDAATAQEAASEAEEYAEEAATAVTTAASGAIQEVHDAVAADRALIEGYKNEAADSVAQVVGIVADAAGTAIAAVQEELSEELARSEAAAAKAEQHEAGAAAAAANEVNKLKGAAPEAFDTLEEIAAELAANETERSALANTIAAKADKVHPHTIEDVAGLADALEAAGTAEHTHSQSEVDGLEAALDGKADVGHKHTSADITDATASTGNPMDQNRVVKTHTGGHIYSYNNPTSDHHLARKGYVDGRTPEVRVVSSLPASPSAGVVYLVTG